MHPRQGVSLAGVAPSDQSMLRHQKRQMAPTGPRKFADDYASILLDAPSSSLFYFCRGEEVGGRGGRGGRRVRLAYLMAAICARGKMSPLSRGSLNLSVRGHVACRMCAIALWWLIVTTLSETVPGTESTVAQKHSGAGWDELRARPFPAGTEHPRGATMDQVPGGGLPAMRGSPSAPRTTRLALASSAAPLARCV